MRLFLWNCQGAFRKKYEQVINQNPDLLIISESESKKKLGKAVDSIGFSDMIWVGDSENKGIGVYSFNKYRLRLHESYNQSFKHIAPIVVEDSQSGSSFLLFAIWTKDTPEEKGERYIAQLWLSLFYYKPLIESNTCVFCGDFNSNKIWDKDDRIANHSMVVEMLSGLSYESLYHLNVEEAQGKESRATFYMGRNLEKPYHIDFCFVNPTFYKESNISIENYEDWKELSDHSPLVVDLEENNLSEFKGLSNVQMLKKYFKSFSKYTQLKFEEEMGELLKMVEKEGVSIKLSQKMLLISRIDRLINRLDEI